MGLFGDIFSGLGQFFGGQEAKKGLNQALGDLGRFTGRIEDYQGAVGTRADPYYGMAGRLGEAGTGAVEALLPTLIQLAQGQQPSEGFKLTAGEGLRQLAGNFATSGAPGSGPAQIAAGRFLSGLGASERDRQIQTLLSVAGLGGQLGEPSGRMALSLEGIRAGLYNPLTDVYGRRAGLFTERGYQRGLNAYNTWSNIGNVGEGIMSTAAGGFSPGGMPASTARLQGGGFF